MFEFYKFLSYMMFSVYTLVLDLERLSDFHLLLRVYYKPKDKLYEFPILLVDESDIKFYSIFRTLLKTQTRYVLIGSCGSSDPNDLGKSFYVSQAFKADRGTLDEHNRFHLRTDKLDHIDHKLRRDEEFFLQQAGLQAKKACCTNFLNETIIDKTFETGFVFDMETYDFYDVCKNTDQSGFTCVRFVTDHVRSLPLHATNDMRTQPGTAATSAVVDGATATNVAEQQSPALAEVLSYLRNVGITTDAIDNAQPQKFNFSSHILSSLSPALASVILNPSASSSAPVSLDTTKKFIRMFMLVDFRWVFHLQAPQNASRVIRSSKYRQRATLFPAAPLYNDSEAPQEVALKWEYYRNVFHSKVCSTFNALLTSQQISSEDTAADIGEAILQLKRESNIDNSWLLLFQTAVFERFEQVPADESQMPFFTPLRLYRSIILKHEASRETPGMCLFPACNTFDCASFFFKKNFFIVGISLIRKSHMIGFWSRIFSKQMSHSQVKANAPKTQARMMCFALPQRLSTLLDLPKSELLRDALKQHYNVIKALCGCERDLFVSLSP
jgi:hypothetical protein